MDPPTGAFSLFSQTIGSSEAYESVSAINILVLRTDSTSDVCYENCLEYLRSHMRYLAVQDLRATQPDYEPDMRDRQRERYLLSIKFSESLAIATEVDAAYISAQSVSQNILFPDVTSTAYVLGTSPKFSLVKERAKLTIRYIEDIPQCSFDPKLFYQGKLFAAIVIHDTEVEDSEAIKNIFYAEASRINDKYGVQLVHLLCRGSKGFSLFDPVSLCPLYPWLKYSKHTDKMRVDTSVEGFSNHTLNYMPCKEVIVLYNATTKITYFLRELVIHCIVCVLRGLVANLEIERFPDSQLLCSHDEAETFINMSRKQRNNFITARTRKLHGDILVMLNNLPQATNLYVQAKNRCRTVGDFLFKGAAGFCLATTLVWLAEKKQQELMESKRLSLVVQEEHTVTASRLMAHRLTKGLIRLPQRSIDRASDAIPSRKSETNLPSEAKRWFGFRRNTSQSTQSRLGNTLSSIYDECSDDEGSALGNTSYSITRQAACELPFTIPESKEPFVGKPVPDILNRQPDKAEDRIVRTFTKAFLLWMQIKNLPRYDFQICIILLLHYMRDKGYYQRLHFVISRMIEYATRQLSANEGIAFLRYIIDFTRDTPYIRKFHYYQFLYEQKSLENNCPVSRDIIERISKKFMLRPDQAEGNNTSTDSNADGDSKEANLLERKTATFRSGSTMTCPTDRAITRTQNANEMLKDSGDSTRTVVSDESTTNNPIMGIQNELCPATSMIQPPGECVSVAVGHSICEVINEDAGHPENGLILTPQLTSIMDNIKGIMTGPYISSPQIDASTQVGWRVTKFLEIQHAHIEMAIRQCETYQMHYANAQLSLINLMMAMDHVLLDQRSNSDAIAKLNGYIAKFKESCQSVSTFGQPSLFSFNHILFAVDVDLKPRSAKCQPNWFSGMNVERRGLFRMTSAGNRLIYHCGGYTKSYHAVPLVTAIKYVESKVVVDNLVHVKSNTHLNVAHHQSSNLKSDYIFRLKGVRRSRSTCVCNFKRWAEGTKSRFAISRTSSAATGSDNGELDTSNIWAHIGSVHSKECVTLVKPRCVVVNRVCSRDIKCNLVKMETKDMPIPTKDTGRSPNSKDSPPSHNVSIDSKCIDINSPQTVEVFFSNPLPVGLLLEDVTLLTVGVKTDIVRRHVLMNQMAKHVGVPIHFSAREKGNFRIVGVSFTLYEHIRCHQVFLNAPMSMTATSINEIVMNPSALYTKTAQLIQKGRCIVFDARMPIYRPVVSYHATQMVSKTSELCIFEHAMCTAKHSLNQQLVPCPVRHVHSTTPSSVASISPRTSGSIYESRHGVRIPTSKDASVPQAVKLCSRESCRLCCITRHNAKESVLIESPNINMIENEEILIFLTLRNDSKDIMMTNLQVSVIPVLDEPEVPKHVMTRSDREFAARKQRNRIAQQEEELVRNFTVLCNRSTVSKKSSQSMEVPSNAGSARSEMASASSWSRGKPNGPKAAVVNPGSTLYVPIIYRAAVTKSDFYFCVDYEYQSPEGTVRASVLKSLSLNVASGISLGNMGINVKPHVEFRVDELIKKLNTPYQPSTLNSLKNFKHIFDDVEVDVDLHVVNATDMPFVCSSKGLSTFTATPHSEAQWRINARRLNYMEAKYMRPSNFVKAMDYHMALQWKLDQSRWGEFRMSDLNHRIPRGMRVSNSSKKQFSKNEYKNAVLSSWKRTVIWKKRVARMPSSLLKTSRVPSAIHANLHHLVESKIALELAVSVGTVEQSNAKLNGNEECCITVTQGVPFQLTVLGRNNSDVVVGEYLTVIIPYTFGTYSEPKGLSWTGSLEQLGLNSLVPSSRFRPYTSSSSSQRASLSLLDDSENGIVDLYNRHIPVAHLSLVAYECLIYGITAAIVVKRDRAIYWHRRPVVVHVVPSE